jgi:hypothetical protein
MNTTALNPVKRSRWLDWKPNAHILADSAESEPTKPSKPGSVDFEGAISAESPKIEAGPDAAGLAWALLNRAGVRIMQLDGVLTISVWSDLDAAEIRAALREIGMGETSLSYLDGEGIPMRYKLRWVEGEPVPMSVLAEMERHPAEPWKVRDRMLKELGWCSKGIAWEEWKAAALNRIFRLQGITGNRAGSVRKRSGTVNP